jgi:hypothetical protein
MLLVEYHSCCPHCFSLGRGLLWGDVPRYELGPAVQQADALVSEPPHTLVSTPHPEYMEWKEAEMERVGVHGVCSRN